MVCAVLAPVAVAVFVGGQCDGALIAANFAGRIRVIGVGVCGFVLDAFVPIRAAIVGAFMPVVCAVLAPVAVAVFVGGRFGFVYRNRQLLHITARAVFRLNGEGCGSLCHGHAADPAGILIQLQTVGQSAAADAPCDGRGAVGCQGLTVRLVHLAARQGVRGDGHAAAGRKLCRQRIHRRRYAVAGGVKLPVVAQPLEIIVLRFSYTIQHWRGECLPVLYNDLYLRLTVHSSTVQLQRHRLQAVLPQRLGVHHLQHRAIVVEYMRAHGSAKSAHAFTIVSPQCVRVIIHLILAPVPQSEASFDIGLILIQYSVPLVVPSASVSSHGSPHGVAHAVALIRLAEDQPLAVQGIPRHTPPCDALRHKQRVRVIAAVLIVLIILYRPVRAHRARVGKCLIVRSAYRGQVEIVRSARLQ